MKAVAIIFFLTFLGCSTAFPVKLDNSKSLASISTLLEEPTDLRSKRQDDSSPVAYAFLLSKLDGSEGDFDGTLVEKRDVKEQDQGDLETAAGTYVLRPLFVYRQQLAYRQRVRDMNRRENRF
ncbi:uncharacterized protein LOC100746404 [Bombus impatiens]|uniref:Uncharacterized protein LOC100746404 n=1 Tax=Bombus impatiens TaxID=132113 RepID=A0A6P3DMZ1_BOMIM|nr:uncharacterized protein LOC100746404 [Bombus impatiens]